MTDSLLFKETGNL
jgi:hypothetical protein